MRVWGWVPMAFYHLATNLLTFYSLGGGGRGCTLPMYNTGADPDYYRQYMLYQ